MQNSNSIQQGKEGNTLNIADLAFYLLGKWRWFILSVAVCMAAAWYNYARQPKVYYRSATAIIKDPSNKTVSSAGLDRYDNVINKVNVANEILQFKSKSLMREVVKRLHADVSYRVDESLHERELYTKAPITVTFQKVSEESWHRLGVKILDANRAKVTVYGNDGDDKVYEAPIGKAFKVEWGTVLITPTDFFNTSWFDVDITVEKSSLTATTAYFQSVLGIQQEEDEASILSLSMRDVSPERAEDVINTLINVYNEEAIRDKNQVAVNTANFISERLAIIAKELGGVEGQLESFKQSNQIIDISSTAGRYMGESQKYSEDAIELETQIRLARYIKDYLADPSKETDLIPANTGIADLSLESQINQYNTMRLRRDRLVADGGEQNPVVEELNNSLRSMKQSIIRAVDNVIVNLNVKRIDAQANERRAQSRVTTIPTKERQMLSIERQQKIKEQLYLFLLNRREENALSQAMADNNARIIDSATGSGSPVAPNRNKIMLLGFLVGIGIPMAAFLTILFMDTRVHNRKDIQGAVSLPFLGEIPQERKRDGEADEKKGIVAEAMRILRTNMAFMAKNGHQPQVITLTSFNEGAGKTFITSKLAMSFVYAKKKVVVVDLDIRKGTYSRGLPHHHKGVSNFLANKSLSLDDILQKGEQGVSPDVVPAGTVPPNPAELLMDTRLDELITELRSRYDYVIADSVPVGIVADASITNRIADLTAFVVRAGRLDRRQLPDLEAFYKEGKLQNMALVLNGVDPHHWGYGYGRYGYYGHYGYGSGYYGYGRHGKGGEGDKASEE